MVSESANINRNKGLNNVFSIIIQLSRNIVIDQNDLLTNIRCIFSNAIPVSKKYEIDNSWN